MGACASTCASWKADAETDEEVTHSPLPGQQQQPALDLAQGPHPLPQPHHPPEGYAPEPPPAPPLAIIGAHGGPIKRDPSLPQLFFRTSQELSMAHLVRHPRLQPFQKQVVGQFGLDGAFEPIKLLGRGGTGQTWLCREAATGKLYALKLQQRPIPRNTIRLQYNEITIQASTCVSSVHSTHIKEVLLTPTHLALVLDYEEGGSLAEFVAKQIPKVSRADLIVDEDFARYAFKQLILGIEHLHDNHVAHRDVKLDNTLIDGETLPTVKLCDFQFAKYWGRPQLTRTKTHLGTAVYMSPELIENRRTHDSYDPVEVDVWAAGIWLAALLLGAFIYDNRPGSDDTAAEMQILQQELGGPWYESRFVRPYVRLLSEGIRDLLTRILHQDPHQRISLEGIKTHPWVNKPLPPHLEKAWERVRHAQLQLERTLSTLQPDLGLVQQRNSRVYDLVREAAAPPNQWEQSFRHISQMCEHSGGLMDCSSMHGVVRINMLPEAVARRLPDRALALLDASPPGTPHRFSLPLQNVPSDTSLSAKAGGGDEGSAAAASGASTSDTEAGMLRQLSPFAATASGG